MVYVMCMCVLNNEYKEVCGCDLWRLTKLRQWCVVWRRTYTTASVSFRNRNCSRTASKPCTRNTCTKTWWVNGLMWWRSSPLKLAYCIRMGSEFFTCRMLTACSHLDKLASTPHHWNTCLAQCGIRSLVVTLTYEALTLKTFLPMPNHRRSVYGKFNWKSLH